MSDANVRSDMIVKQLAIMDETLREISSTRGALRSQYQQLGQSWNDTKYRELGNIIREVNASLSAIEKEFLMSQKSLVQILRAVIEYESTSLTNSVNSGASGQVQPCTAGADSAAYSTDQAGGFSGFGIQAAPWNNDTLFVKGNHFDEFLAFRTSGAGYDSDDLLGRGADYITDVNTASIEGIHISQYDAANQERFWSQHDSDGTFATFREIASHIPEVRSKIQAGENPDEWSGALSDCYGIYFRDPVMVDDCGGYYEFCGNGRHRILAARSLGYDIPVHVVHRHSLRN